MTHPNTDREIAATSPTYDVAMTDVDNKAVSEKNEGLYAECSMATLDNTYAALEKTELQQKTEQIYMNAGNAARKTASKTPKKQRFDVTSCRALACIFTSIAVMAVIMIICIVYFSAEIAKLNAQTASIQQSPFGHPAAEVMQADILRRLNSSINSLLENQTNQLNSSGEMIYSLLDNRINQLSRSIDHLHQQIKSVSENNTLALQSYIIEQNEVNYAIANQLNRTEMRLSQNISILEYRAEQLSEVNLGVFSELPASSCAALLTTNPSGYYWVSASNGSAVRVYCDMTRSCGGVTGGWVRVGYLDMTDSSHQCPSGFTEHSDSNIRTCRRADTSAGCGSVMMDVPYQYSRVCGRVRAYQVSTTNAFQGRPSPSIDSNYVDGVSLTRGSPRQHIWTFVAGLQKGSESFPSLCPCTSSAAASPPAFVGDDYFCDSGNPLHVRTPPNPTVYSDDPLWDGNGCEPTNTCCSFNDPPWFHKQLSDLTTDDIEMRVCTDEGAHNENVDIEIVEIYVQ